MIIPIALINSFPTLSYCINLFIQILLEVCKTLQVTMCPTYSDNFIVCNTTILVNGSPKLYNIL